MNFTGRLIEKRESRGNMEFKVGEIIKMKKKHPCGANEWKLLRVGMDFRLQCMNCGREVMVPRKLVEKNFGDIFIKISTRVCLKNQTI